MNFVQTKLTLPYLESMLAQLEKAGVSRERAVRHLSSDLHRKTYESLPRLLALAQANQAANALVDKLSI